MSAPLSAQIVALLGVAELTSRDLFTQLAASGYGGTYGAVKRSLLRLLDAEQVRIARLEGNYQSRVFALPDPDSREDGPLRHRTLPPVGIIPTRKYDPIAWIVATSGVELEAA